MPLYGTSLSQLAKALEEEGIVLGTERDWTVELALCLASAFVAVERAEAQGVSFSVGNNNVVVKGDLEKAWRSLLYVRSKKTTESVITSDVARRVTISKTGRIIRNADQASHRAFRTSLCNTCDRSKGRHKHAPARREKRRRA